MNNTQKVISDTYRSLKGRCEAAGTNLNAVCKAAGIPRQTVESWKIKEPKTFILLNRLLDAIETERAKQHVEA